MKPPGKVAKAPVGDGRRTAFLINGNPYKLAVGTMHGDVAPVPFGAVEAERTVKGKSIDRSNAGVAAEAVVASVALLSNNAYKVAITKTLVKRALASWFKIRV